jgi:hypothetical protein
MEGKVRAEKPMIAPDYGFNHLRPPYSTATDDFNRFSPKVPLRQRATRISHRSTTPNGNREFIK